MILYYDCISNCRRVFNTNSYIVTMETSTLKVWLPFRGWGQERQFVMLPLLIQVRITHILFVTLC
jgi:hypothetical protein